MHSKVMSSKAGWHCGSPKKKKKMTGKLREDETAKARKGSAHGSTDTGQEPDGTNKGRGINFSFNSSVAGEM